MIGELAEYVFLSHLCGGEVIVLRAVSGDDFLSHLCGGEGGGMSDALIMFFLSHLCGGEVHLSF